MSKYIAKCPKCKIEELEFDFAGRNGYVSICPTCKVLLYYCSIFGKVLVFVQVDESYDMSYNDMKYKSGED